MWNEFLYSLSTYPFLYVLFSIPLFLWIAVAVWAVVRLNHAPGDSPRLSGAGLFALLQEGWLQRRIWRIPLAGVMHACLMLSGVFLVGAFVVTHYVAPRGEAWQASTMVHLVADIGVVLGVAGLLLAGWRRFVRKAPPRSVEDTVLWALAVLFVSSYGSANALLVAISEPVWQKTAFLSHGVGSLLSGFEETTLRSIYGMAWAIVHGSLFAGALLVPLTKWRHAFAISYNLTHPLPLAEAEVETMDLDNDGPFGLSQPVQLSGYQLTELWACVHCGRCSSVCPAVAAGADLDPMHVVETELAATGDVCLSETVGQAALWQCTMCLACAEVCPAGVHPWRHILDMRRDAVLERAQFPSALQDVFRGVERYDNPWGATASKSEIARTAAVRVLGEGDSCDVLLWMGCMVAVDDTARRAWIALARLLLESGLDVGCLGDREPCCGDMVRRTGNEYLWQEQVTKVVSVVNEISVGRVVSTCPHCVNALSSEYPLGLWQGVSHALVELERLWKDGAIWPGETGQEVRVAYHDPCYLARGLDVVAPVRDLLAATPGCELLETRHNGKSAWCCGAGGGQMWLADGAGRGELGGELFEELRVLQADLLLSACPYCDSVLESEFGRESDVQDAVLFVASRWCATKGSERA